MATGRSRTIHGTICERAAERAGLLPADVLIVEDDPIIAMDLEEIVQRFGVKATRTAASVAQALQLIATAPPEFALLDVGLRDETSSPSPTGSTRCRCRSRFSQATAHARFRCRASSSGPSCQSRSLHLMW